MCRHLSPCTGIMRQQHQAWRKMGNRHTQWWTGESHRDQAFYRVQHRGRESPRQHWMQHHERQLHPGMQQAHLREHGNDNDGRPGHVAWEGSPRCNRQDRISQARLWRDSARFRCRREPDHGTEEEISTTPVAKMKIIAIFATASGEMLEWLRRHAWTACIRQNRN